MHILTIIVQMALNSHVITNSCMNVEFNLTAYQLTSMTYKHYTTPYYYTHLNNLIKNTTVFWDVTPCSLVHY